MNSDNFYKKLTASTRSLPELLQNDEFVDVPNDWFVIIADIKNSTTAVNAGHHNDVTLVAASALIVALNIAKDNNVEIPFFFQGDGGTVLVPPLIVTDVRNGLNVHNTNSITNFNLEFHIGSLSIEEIKKSGHWLKIAKVKFGKNMSKAIIIGDGLPYAEEIIKHNEEGIAAHTVVPDALNMDGLECRWNKIRPLEESNEIVCYLIEATKPGLQAQVYADVLQKMDAIYGTLEKRNPISLKRLKLLLSVRKIKREMLARFGKWKQKYFLTAFLETFLGLLYFKFNLNINNLRGHDYLKQVVANAYILTIDGRISSIIASTSDKHKAFIEYLSQLEHTGMLVFGHFTSRESVMTCYIENRNENHIHFVDGTNGGYTEAAKEFKNKKAQTGMQII